MRKRLLALPWPVYAILGGAVVTLLLPSGESYTWGLLGLGTLNAVGLGLLVGYTRQLSLGQSAFYGFGAYVAGWTTLHLVPNGWLGLVAGTVASGLLAYLLGWPVLRLRGHYLALSSLALAIIATVLFTELSGFTGGVQGMSGIRPLGFGGQPLSLRMTVLLVWVLLGALSWVLVNVELSPIGRALRSVGNDEILADSLGLSSHRLKVNVFALSGAVGGLAGGLYATMTTYVSPAAFPFVLSIQWVVMVALGGAESLLGAFLGGILVGGLGQVLLILSSFPSAPPTLPAILENVVDGLLLFVAVAFLPRGLLLSRRRG